MAAKKPAREQPRHTEAKLERELGTAPVVELHGMVKVRAGRVVGVWLGPHDMAEMLAVQGFTTSLSRDEGTSRIGLLLEVPFFLMEEDLP